MNLLNLSLLLTLIGAALSLLRSSAAQSLLQGRIDMRAEIVAGRFDPLTDCVGVRGAGSGR